MSWGSSWLWQLFRLPFFFFLWQKALRMCYFVECPNLRVVWFFFMISLWIWILGGVYTGKMPFSLYPIKDIFYSIPYHSWYLSQPLMKQCLSNFSTVKVLFSSSLSMLYSLEGSQYELTTFKERRVMVYLLEGKVSAKIPWNLSGGRFICSIH